MSEADGQKQGLKTAVEAAHDPEAARPGDVQGEQLALLPLRKADEGSAARKNGGALPRGRGRPPGAKNKRTEEWTEYLLGRYPSPLIGLAEIAFRPLTDLAEELGFNNPGPDGIALRRAKPQELLELLRLQRDCMKELAPYLHQKQPMAIDGGEHGLIHLTIGQVGGGMKQAQEGQDFDVEFLPVENEENQGVSGDDPAKSDAGESDTLHLIGGESGEE